jgi:transposase
MDSNNTAMARFSLYAPVNIQSGMDVGNTVARHTSAEFVAFLTDLVANQPKGKEILVICDNLAAHKTQTVREFLDAHPKVQIHYAPTYSSLLNQVEPWFNRIERDVIVRGIFTLLADLQRKVMRYIRQYNKAPKPIKWIYRDPSH